MSWRQKRGIWPFFSDSLGFLGYRERSFSTGSDEGGGVRSPRKGAGRVLAGAAGGPRALAAAGGPRAARLCVCRQPRSRALL